jgi:hypothetical protein
MPRMEILELLEGSIDGAVAILLFRRSGEQGKVSFVLIREAEDPAALSQRRATNLCCIS